VSEDRRSLRLVASPYRLDGFELLRRFEAAHPEVTVLRPGGLNDPWRAIVPPGTIPGKPLSTTLSAVTAGGLLDQLRPLFPAPQEDPR
jgi:hypothetical protein